MEENVFNRYLDEEMVEKFKNLVPVTDPSVVVRGDGYGSNVWLSLEELSTISYALNFTYPEKLDDAVDSLVEKINFSCAYNIYEGCMDAGVRMYIPEWDEV